MLKGKWSRRKPAEIFPFSFLLTETFSLGKVKCFNVFNKWQGLEKMEPNSSQRSTVAGQEEIGTSSSKEVSG